MIKIPGHLAIRTIQGRNGAFNVGRLSTSIGEFVIKDAVLEQHVEGKITGKRIQNGFFWRLRNRSDWDSSEARIGLRS